MKAFALKCLLIFIFAVQLCSASSVSKHQKKFNYNIHIDQSLEYYESYIGSLNPNNLFTIAAAEKKFNELFSDIPTYIKEQAFIVFWNFYLTAADFAGIRLTNNNNYKYIVGIKDYDSNPDKYENLKYYLILNKNILNENDFKLLKLLNSYGLMFDIKDSSLIINFGSKDYILNSFGNNLTSSMRDYISETIMESGEQFMENDRLVISINKLAERTIWWENFINRNNNFILISECKLTHDFYLNTLLQGIDDAVAGNKSQLNKKDKTNDYAEIVAKYAGTKTAEEIKSRFKLINKGDFTSQLNNETFVKYFGER